MSMDRYVLFAANAPTEIPEWFRVDEKQMPARPVHNTDSLWADLSIEAREEINSAIEEREIRYKDFPAEAETMRKYVNAYFQFEKDRHEWVLKCAEIEYFQWRHYYAVEMAKQTLTIEMNDH